MVAVIISVSLPMVIYHVKETQFNLYDGKLKGTLVAGILLSASEKSKMLDKRDCIQMEIPLPCRWEPP